MLAQDALVGVICDIIKFNMKSKIGITLAGLYSLLVISMYIEESDCSMFCGLGQEILGAPWTFIADRYGNNDTDVILFLILNAVILYFIGLGISKSINFFKNK